MERKFALVDVKREKYGVCALCDFEGKLSRTHVPPQAAGNRGPAQTAVLIHNPETGGLRRSHGTPKDGGTWGWWFCEPCNHRSELWEREYVRWAHSLGFLFVQQKPRYGRRIECGMPSGDPGAVGRLLWAWTFALDPRMRIFYPSVAASILSGEPCEPPPNRRLLLAATPDDRIWLTGRTQPWIGITPTIPHTIISSPPFVAVLADQHYTEGDRWMDVASWLTEKAGDRRSVVLELPIVCSFDEAGPVEDQPLNDAERMRNRTNANA